MNIESLESRRLMSAGVTWSSSQGTWQLVSTAAGFTITKAGTMVIKGTDAADVITVIRDGNWVKVGNGAGVTVIAASEFKRVLIEAGSGNDKVFIDDELKKYATVLAGGGHDNVEANSGATVIGGGGNDKLSLPPSRAWVLVPAGSAAGLVLSQSVNPGFLSGGDGNDALSATAYDFVAGGKGTDTLVEHYVYNLAPDTTPTFDPEQSFGDHATGIEHFTGFASVDGKVFAVNRFGDIDV